MKVIHMLSRWHASCVFCCTSPTHRRMNNIQCSFPWISYPQTDEHHTCLFIFHFDRRLELQIESSDHANKWDPKWTYPVVDIYQDAEEFTGTDWASHFNAHVCMWTDHRCIMHLDPIGNLPQSRLMPNTLATLGSSKWTHTDHFTSTTSVFNK